MFPAPHFLLTAPPPFSPFPCHPSSLQPPLHLTTPITLPTNNCPSCLSLMLIFPVAGHRAQCPVLSLLAPILSLRPLLFSGLLCFSVPSSTRSHLGPVAVPQSTCVFTEYAICWLHKSAGQCTRKSNDQEPKTTCWNHLEPSHGAFLEV